MMSQAAIWLKNGFIERLRRLLKYGAVYLNAFDNMRQARQELENWIDYYNTDRPRSALNAQTPVELYEGVKPFSFATLM